METKKRNLDRFAAMLLLSRKGKVVMHTATTWINRCQVPLKLMVLSIKQITSVFLGTKVVNAATSFHKAIVKSLIRFSPVRAALSATLATRTN